MMNQTHARQILRGEYESIVMCRHVLTRVWRMTLREIKMEYRRFDSLMEYFIAREASLNNGGNMESLKGNIIKEIVKDKLSWANFVRGITILNFRQTEIHLTFTREDIDVTDTVTLKVPILTLNQMDFERRNMDTNILLENISQLRKTWESLHEYYCRDIDWEDHLSEYAEKRYRELRGTDHEKDKYTIRSDVRKKLKKENITWEAFLEGVQVLGINKMEILVYLKTHRPLTVPLDVTM